MLFDYYAISFHTKGGYTVKMCLKCTNYEYIIFNFVLIIARCKYRSLEPNVVGDT